MEDDTLLDKRGSSFVWLVLQHRDEGEFLVGILYVFPKAAFRIMEGDKWGSAWEQVPVSFPKVATPG